ncbi:hypothetical protein ILUMI_21963 [Ignelater luminosus]|uniref:Uncharacterized protein n=1 Tax=Ignelater luminosus TaxID=2038154 RepID=A0A8K0CGP9_IGNLU|nr:hypothetical protein ILUMI_21963 [Ignelater luminosus]
MEILKDDVEQNEDKEDSDKEFDSSKNEIEESKEEYVPDGKNKVSILFTKNGLNNLIRRYAMPKDVYQDLISELKSRNVVVPGTNSSIYRETEKEFRKYYTKDKETSLVYYLDVPGFMNELKPNIHKRSE